MILTATIAGLIAGAVMSVEKMIEAALEGKGFWRPPNLIASVLLGERADTGRFLLDGFLVGMALHALAPAFMGWLWSGPWPSPRGACHDEVTTAGRRRSESATRVTVDASASRLRAWLRHRVPS